MWSGLEPPPPESSLLHIKAIPGASVSGVSMGRKTRAQEEGKSSRLGGLVSEPGRSSHTG